MVCRRNIKLYPAYRVKWWGKCKLWLHAIPWLETWNGGEISTIHTITISQVDKKNISRKKALPSSQYLSEEAEHPEGGRSLLSLHTALIWAADKCMVSHIKATSSLSISRQLWFLVNLIASYPLFPFSHLYNYTSIYDRPSQRKKAISTQNKCIFLKVFYVKTFSKIKF